MSVTRASPTAFTKLKPLAETNASPLYFCKKANRKTQQVLHTQDLSASKFSTQAIERCRNQICTTFVFYLNDICRSTSSPVSSSTAKWTEVFHSNFFLNVQLCQSFIRLMDYDVLLAAFIQPIACSSNYQQTQGCWSCHWLRNS